MSPRPKKHRHCSCPHRPTLRFGVYKPAGISMKDLSVLLPADELEALRFSTGWA